jgi:signal transduction histidine kinase
LQGSGRITVKIIITGKKDKLWKAAGVAFSGTSGIRATILPVGSQVIEAARDPSYDAVVFTLSTDEETELLRWVLQINPSLPLIALMPAMNPKLRKLAQEEGAAQVWEVSNPDPAAIRRLIAAPQLRKLGQATSISEARRQISDGLHAIRSALTVIMGNAEMALKRTAQPAARRKRIQEIPRGVVEIERILRRLHRLVKSQPLGLKRTT